MFASNNTAQSGIGAGCIGQEVADVAMLDGGLIHHLGDGLFALWQDDGGKMQNIIASVEDMRAAVATYDAAG